MNAFPTSCSASSELCESLVGSGGTSKPPRGVVLVVVDAVAGRASIPAAELGDAGPELSI